MDVEMEMNGLPTSFGNVQESDSALHEASNVIASASNAETTPIAPSKSIAQTEPSEPITSIMYTEEVRTAPTEAPFAGTHPTSTQTVNGNHMDHVEVFNETQSSLAESSIPTHNADIPPSTQTSNLPSESIPLSSSIDSVTKSSIPINAQTSDETPASQSREPEVAVEQSIMNFHTEPTPLPEQPISDLRTSAQTELLISETSLIPAQSQSVAGRSDTPARTGVNELQLQSDQPAAPYSNMSQTPPADAGHETPASIEMTATEIQLPSSPTRSPPPAPQPAFAVLPPDTSSTDSLPPATVVPAPNLAPIQQVQGDMVAVKALPSLPTEEPRDPAPTPAQPTLAETSVDHTMTDAPSPPVKVAREREEDLDESEPLAKRAKTYVTDDQPNFKVPDVPRATQSPADTNGASAPTDATVDEEDQVTPARLAHMKKIVSNLKKGNSSLHFRLPVDWQGLNIPTYPDIIETPMDLGTIDTKLKNNAYKSVKDFVTDFELIVNNSITFNGAEHAVTQTALKMQSSFNNQIANMPKAGVAEPSKEEKRAQKLKNEPTRSAPPRRQSMTAPSGGSARSPSGAASAQTFALGPEGVPLIRRDSTIDGRAKRAIIPTKRQSDFGSGRPKKKKYELQLKFCWEVLKEMQSTKHWNFAQYFYYPVDPVALNIPTYFQVIKKPMDLQTVQQKLENNVYEKAKDFEEDVRMIFKNCFKFNPEGEYVNTCGHQLEELFNKKWDTKDDWLAAREPSPENHSAIDDEEDEEESDEAEDDDSEDERNEKIAALQKQIAEMGKQMSELAQPKKKKKSTPPMPPKKSGKVKTEKKEKHAGAPKHADSKSQSKDKKKPTKTKVEKDRFVTYGEKQYISNGISQLPDKQMGEALKIIQTNVPSLKDTAETEIELDIDELPNGVLLKLLAFVKKYGGGPLPEEPRQAEPTYAAAPVGGKPKKNKPMGKAEQEQQIEELKGKLGAYSGGLSPNAVPSIENNVDTSGDEGSDSEESEEE